MMTRGEDSTCRGLERPLDGVWDAGRRRAVASAFAGEQSEAVLSLRMQCLDRRLAELSALVNLLAGADKAIVTGAVDAAAALRDALWKSRRDRARARALAGEALAGVATAGNQRTAAMKATIESWLTHPR